MCVGLARPELLQSTWRYRQERREANRGPQEPSVDPARVWMKFAVARCLLAVRVQWMRLSQRAAESQFVVSLEELGGGRGRSELGRGYWHRAGRVSSRGTPT